MIKLIDNPDDIVSLWAETFGDTADDILFFINNLSHGSAIAYYSDDKPASMLYLVDCTVNGIDYKYIYAACTALAARKRGYMSLLLDYCREHFKNIILIPADENLVTYYSKRGINEKIEINNITFYESKEITEYLFEGCKLEKPFALGYKGE